ncbi:hypothetical protein ACFRI7_26745 [Streptomyces sp. NPDC056716]|uniref:hypothetical protein n=1 Tax=unclassified Streptomyces TaxID=2593676 RepID=UPI003698110F
MDLDSLRNASFALLDEAVTDWSTLVSNLETLKRDAEEQLRQKANSADWAGVNAQVTKEFIGKTAVEFTDAHIQARTIHGILEDTRGELKNYHRQLTEAIEDGRNQGLTVIGSEGGFLVTNSGPPGAGAQQNDDNQTQINSLRDRIQGILDQATESDDSARQVLKAVADQSELGFSDVSYGDRDAAQEALKQAETLARLAAQDPQDLSVEEFDQLLRGLEEYGDDELFAERFATALGPEKTLEFWAGVSDTYRGNYELGQERLDRFDDLQRSLGTTLANATQSDSAAMAEWKRTMIDIGDKPVGGGVGSPMGFQVMSNLMRTGDYDDRFLGEYGTKLMATERELTGNGEHSNLAWEYSGMDPWLNRIGEDSGSDPFTGFLKGLSNSPDAATAFFNQEFIARDDPDNPFERDTDGDDKKGTFTLSNFQYLFEERNWPQETSLTGEELNTGKNNLALALEAATTGHPAGEMPTADTPAHNEGQTRLFESLVASIADDSTRLTEDSYMSDSMGQIAAEYLPDINRAATDVDQNPDSDDLTGQERWERAQNLFPIAGSAAELNHRDVSRFLFTIGQNPEGYAAVEVAQTEYMANLMDYHLDPELPANQRPDSDRELTVRAIAYQSGETSGTLAMGRNQAVASGAVESDAAYDQSVSQWKNFASGTIGLGVGIGASFIASPVVGAGVAGATGTVTSMVLEELFSGAEGNAAEDAGPTMGENWENGQDSNMSYTTRAATEAARAHEYPDPNAVGTWAETESPRGFLAAGEYMERVAPELLTEI